MDAGTVAGSVGRGLIAGLLGTALMTVSSTIEMRVRRRPPYMVPARVVEELFGLETASDADRERLSSAVHWMYGIGWGGVRGLLDTLSRLNGPAAAGVHLVTVWGSGLVVLPSMGVASSINEMPRREVAIDLLHHAVYALVTHAAYEVLRRGRA
jgi:hypothetical protein